ncbi:MAG: hypothetical protein IPM34_07565 [Saprospiraceae bacterium]|nr:hypothetical protein [Saprospiraceae bacterium]
MNLKIISFLAIWLWVAVGNSQSDNLYKLRATNLVKDFYSQINLFINPDNTENERRTNKEFILKELVTSSDSIGIYDNISDSYENDIPLTPFNYLRELERQFSMLIVKDENKIAYLSFEFGNFKKDTSYWHQNSLDWICEISLDLSYCQTLNSARSTKRTDSISFEVIFKGKDLDNPKLLSSYKYKTIPTANLPKDIDSDGVVDALDDCPDLVGLPECKGCPDSDKDGVCDFEDKCPYTKGSKKRNGCPEIPLTEKKPPILENVKKKISTIEIPINFNINELLAMKANSFELSYSKMKFPNIPELRNIETIVFQITKKSEHTIQVDLLKFISPDRKRIIILKNLTNQLDIADNNSEVTIIYNINIKEQRDLNSILHIN